MEQTELDLREIVRVLRRRLWILILMPTVAALVAGLVSLFVLTPVYQASTTMWVVKEGDGAISYNDVLLNRNLTKTYAAVATSDVIMAQVIDDLGLTGTIEGLKSKLTVTPVRDTELLEFTISDTNPEQAARLVTAVAEAFKGQISKSIKVDNVTVVDPARVPTGPVKPRPLMNVALATVLGGMAAIGLIFVLEYLDTTIKTPDDVARHLGLPVLGVIPVIEASEAPVVSPRRARSRSTQAEAVVDK